MITRIAVVAGILCTAAGSQEMVRLPAGGFDVVDQVTTLKLRVTVSEFLLGAAEVRRKSTKRSPERIRLSTKVRIGRSKT
jgi:hypothetical protein